MKKYGDATQNLKLQEEQEAQAFRDKWIKRKVKSSPVVKKRTLKKVIKTISDFGYDKQGDYLGNKGSCAWENGNL